jgi:hypothetical protein
MTSYDLLLDSVAQQNPSCFYTTFIAKLPSLAKSTYFKRRGQNVLM